MGPIILPVLWPLSFWPTPSHEPLVFVYLLLLCILLFICLGSNLITILLNPHTCLLRVKTKTEKFPHLLLMALSLTLPVFVFIIWWIAFLVMLNPPVFIIDILTPYCYSNRKGGFLLEFHMLNNYQCNVFRTGALAKGSAFYGRGSGPIQLDDLSCTGTEKNLALCGHRGWGKNNCDHTEDASVICRGKFTWT